jgi:hypothetical protein
MYSMYAYKYVVNRKEILLCQVLRILKGLLEFG